MCFTPTSHSFLTVLGEKRWSLWGVCFDVLNGRQFNVKTREPFWCHNCNNSCRRFAMGWLRIANWSMLSFTKSDVLLSLSHTRARTHVGTHTCVFCTRCMTFMDHRQVNAHVPFHVFTCVCVPINDKWIRFTDKPTINHQSIVYQRTGLRSGRNDSFVRLLLFYTQRVFVSSTHVYMRRTARTHARVRTHLRCSRFAAIYEVVRAYTQPYFFSTRRRTSIPVAADQIGIYENAFADSLPLFFFLSSFFSFSPFLGGLAYFCSPKKVATAIYGYELWKGNKKTFGLVVRLDFSN